MRLKEIEKFDSVTIYRLGWSPVGRPLMTVCLYVMDDLMIDSGQPHMKNEAVEVAHSHNVSRVLLTHHHEDHAGNAGDIKKICGAKIFCGSLTAEKIRQPLKIMPYQYLVWGRSSPCEADPLPERIDHGNHIFNPVFTPGHAKDHFVFHEKERGWLFSGDLFLGTRIKFFRSDENIKDQIDSLKKACGLDFDVLFCGHNPVFEKGKEALEKKLSYLEDVYGKCQEAWYKGIPLKNAVEEIGLREATFIKAITCGNASFKNIISSAYESFEKTSAHRSE